jgi:hypothetical protein
MVGRGHLMTGIVQRAIRFVGYASDFAAERL